jgi:hypothetical protein
MHGQALKTVLAWPPTLPPTNHEGRPPWLATAMVLPLCGFLAVRGVGAEAIAAITASQISFVAFSS